MKRLSIAVILLVTVLGNTYAHTLSGPVETKFVGSDNFYHTYPQATDVHCKCTGQFTEVNFTWNGMQLQAFYDRDGNSIATARTIARG